MTVELNDLVAKLNFVRASKLLKEHGMIENHITFPKNRDEEAEMVKQMLYAYIKRKFVGCKLRANNMTFSLRLDGETHRKVKKVKDLLQDAEWRKWFQDNHRVIFDTVQRHQNVFNGDAVEMKVREGREFLYVPIQTNRLHNYGQEGVMRTLNFLEKSYEREKQVATMYDQVIGLMEGERQRKAEERRRRIQSDHDTYLARIKDQLMPKIAKIDRESTTFEGKLAVRMYDWCKAQKIEPVVAKEPTFQRVVPLGINVEIIAKGDQDDQDWFAVPTFGGYELPEGFQLIDGYGEVTGHDATHARSRNGEAPIVVAKYIYLQFKVDFWKHDFPERYDELLAITNQFAEEVKQEVDRADEERKATEQREAEERQQRQEQELKDRLENQKAAAAKKEVRDKKAHEAEEQAAREEQERITRLRDQLQAQLGQAQEAETAAEPNPAEFEAGIYRNDRAIPLEKYVAVYGGEVRRFPTITSARGWLRGQGGNTTEIRNYHDVTDIVETI